MKCLFNFLITNILVSFQVRLIHHLERLKHKKVRSQRERTFQCPNNLSIKKYRKDAILCTRTLFNYLSKQADK